MQLLTPPRQAGRTSEISPFKSYAEAVSNTPRAQETTGCPSPGSPRDRSSDDVNSETSVLTDNLSVQEGSVTNEKSSDIRVSDRNQESTPTITDPSTNTTNNRKRWTKEEQVDLFRCYCEAIKKGPPP